MASRGNGSHSQEPSHDDGDDALPTSELTRPSPDAILADEADPDTLLGMESDSDAGSSRPASMLPPGKRTSKRVSRQLLDVPLDDDDGTAGHAANGASPKAVDHTPTQTSFTPSASSSKRTSVYARNETELRGQVSELTTQVTSLNNKLVTSFMRIGDLEDDISQMQEAIASYRQQVSTLEKEREEHLAALNTGLLVEKEHVSNEMQKMMERLIQETAEKGKAVDERQKIESELDELSSSLFSEANKMVAVERLARARAEEKSKSMEDRLKDTEEIVGQQQKRLVELQGLVEKAELREKDAGQSNAASTGLLQTSTSSNGPSSLITISQGNLRLDIIPYVELRAFLNHLRRLRLQLAPFYTYPLTTAQSPLNDEQSSSAHATPYTSRTASPAPSQSGLSAQSGALSPSYLGSMSASSTSASPFAVANVARHKDFPSLPANVEQLIHLPNQVSSLSFLKRINEEDSEPCLRLDVAPGLNWLSRRQLQSAILDGSLMIEPIFGGGIYDEAQVRQRAIGAPPAACAMCGKVVVNVPLPGGGNSSDASSWMSAASTLSAGMNAMTNSLPGRDSTASPPPSTSSFSSSTASSNRDGGKAKTGILSSLRNISGSSSWSLASSTVSESASSATTASASAAAAQAQTVTVLEDPFAPPRPPAIPTHIFRISETSQSRYLLCPNYCLRRLRAACDFWGYIRNLERAVVLEGKLAWDDEANAASESAKPSSSTGDDAKKAQEESTPRLPTKDSELSKGNLTSDGDDEGAVSKEAEEGDEDDKKSEETTQEAEPKEDDTKEEEKAEERNGGVGTRKSSINQTHSDAEDSDFADAQSQHSESSEKEQDEDEEDENAKEAEADKVDETVKVKDDKSDENAKEPSADTSETTEEASAPSATVPATEEREEEKGEKKEDEKKQESAAGAPPPLPKTTRPRPVPARPVPSTPPTLPPRRSVAPPTPPVRHGSPIVDLGPEPRRLLPLSANQTDSAARETVWEEKVWLEVNRLRADMWSARIGVE